MARDYTLLRRAREGVFTLRIYAWQPACLSFGRNEPALRRYDRALLETDGVDVVRRPTGGRAVWHEAEVTYSVTGPDGLLGSLRETYILIHQMISDALNGLGAQTTVVATGKPGDLDGGLCFSAPVGGEVTGPRGKVVGSAQIRDQGGFLQHGSILLRNDQSRVERYELNARGAQAASALDQLLDREPAFEEVANALANQAPVALGMDFAAAGFEEELDPGIDFADPGWTWRR